MGFWEPDPGLTTPQSQIIAVIFTRLPFRDGENRTPTTDTPCLRTTTILHPEPEKVGGRQPEVS